MSPGRINTDLSFIIFALTYSKSLTNSCENIYPRTDGPSSLAAKYTSMNMLSDHACKIIEEVAMSVENNKYVYLYHFIDVTTFEFLGEHIAAGANCGLKRVMLVF